MMTAGILVLWAGYGLASYGWVLLKGYNITIRQWFSPLNPYTWQGTPAQVPAGQILPS